LKRAKDQDLCVLRRSWPVITISRMPGCDDFRDRDLNEVAGATADLSIPVV